MGDTDWHTIARLGLFLALQDFFAEVLDVYITTNLIFYYQYGNARARCDPDVLVARGVGKHQRRSYRIWEENVVPCTLFEVASQRTWKQDLGAKRHLYAQLGVKEYFVFDPEYCYINPPLQGFRLQKGLSVAMKCAPDGGLTSRQLGLRMIPEGVLLRLFDLRTGQPVLTKREQIEHSRHEYERAHQEYERARQEIRRANREKRRAEKLVAELAAVRAELERLRKGQA
jgi:hypothetical protein